MIQPLELRAFRGPNVYASTPMIFMRLDIGILEGWPSNTIPNFVDRLLTDIPSLREHGCCFGEPGGFVKRLEMGTWFGHILEHVAIELQSLAGFDVTRGKTRSAGPTGVYNVLFA